MSVNIGAAWTLSPAQARRLRIDSLWQVADGCLAKLRELANAATDEQHVEAFMERIKLAGVCSFLEGMEANDTLQALSFKVLIDGAPSWDEEDRNGESPVNFIATMQIRKAPLVELPKLDRETWEKFSYLIEQPEGPGDADRLSIELSTQFPEETSSGTWRDWARTIAAATEGPLTLQ